MTEGAGTKASGTAYEWLLLEVLWGPHPGVAISRARTTGIRGSRNDVEKFPRLLAEATVEERRGMIKRLELQSGTQVFAFSAGVVYLVVGVLGFALTGFSHFAGPAGSRVLGFELNPLHNVIHLALGGAWLWSSRHRMVAKKMNLVLGSTLALISVLGLLGALRILAIEGAGSLDNYLHLVTAAVALYFGYSDVDMRRSAAA